MPRTIRCVGVSDGDTLPADAEILHTETAGPTDDTLTVWYLEVQSGGMD